MKNESTGDSSIRLIWLIFITPLCTLWLHAEENGVDSGVLSFRIISPGFQKTLSRGKTGLVPLGD